MSGRWSLPIQGIEVTAGFAHGPTVTYTEADGVDSILVVRHTFIDLKRQSVVCRSHSLPANLGAPADTVVPVLLERSQGLPARSSSRGSFTDAATPSSHEAAVQHDELGLGVSFSQLDDTAAVPCASSSSSDCPARGPPARSFSREPFTDAAALSFHEAAAQHDEHGPGASFNQLGDTAGVPCASSSSSDCPAASQRSSPSMPSRRPSSPVHSASRHFQESTSDDSDAAQEYLGP